MTAYTPKIFALRQMLFRAIPLGAFFLAFFLIYFIVGKLFNTVIVILSVGGMAFIYLGWFLTAYSKGLIDTPRRQWHVGFDNGMINIDAVWGRTVISLDTVKNLILISDDNWDLLKGVEDKCLKLVPLYGYSIIIPGTSANFEAMLAAIQKLRNVETVLVE